MSRGSRSLGDRFSRETDKRLRSLLRPFETTRIPSVEGNSTRIDFARRNPVWILHILENSQEGFLNSCWQSILRRCLI